MSYAVIIKTKDSETALVIAAAFAKSGICPLIEGNSVVILLEKKDTADKLLVVIPDKWNPIIEERT